MKHIPNKYDVITDLRRCLSASYADRFFEDENAKVFLLKAKTNLDRLKNDLEEETYLEVAKRIDKAKDERNPVNRRREDLLTASCLLY